MKCKHSNKQEIVESFRGAIQTKRPDPRSHGNVTIRETCLDCGASRVTNSNAGVTETTGWYDPQCWGS